MSGSAKIIFFFFFLGGGIKTPSVEAVLKPQHGSCVHRQNLLFLTACSSVPKVTAHLERQHKLRHKSACESLSQRAYEPAVVRTHFKHDRKKPVRVKKKKKLCANYSFMTTTTTTPESRAAVVVVGREKSGWWVKEEHMLQKS